MLFDTPHDSGGGHKTDTARCPSWVRADVQSGDGFGGVLRLKLPERRHLGAVRLEKHQIN